MPYTQRRMKSRKSLLLSVALSVSGILTGSLLTGCGGGGSSSNSGGGSGSGSGSGSGAGSGNSASTPTVASISPTSVIAGSGPLTLTVNGTNFLSTTTVNVGGVADPTTYVSSTQVTATVPAAQLASGAQLVVVAQNGSASSGAGTPINLQVNNPLPVITAATLSTQASGSGTTPVAIVSGTGFVPTTAIQVNGSNRATAFISGTQLIATLLSADVSTTSSLSLIAVNSTPGGGTSAAQNLPVTSNPAPGSGSLSSYYVLSSATPPVTINVTGSYYTSTSVVELNGIPRTTTYISPTEVSFQLTAADLAIAQRFAVTVFNPSPGGGSASAGYLIVYAATPAPVITSISPNQLYVDAAQTTITVYGSNLYQPVAPNSSYLTSTVLWNGTPLATNYFSTGSSPAITATVPANLLTAAGSATITVQSITSTPSVSNSLTMNIVNPPAPTITQIYPSNGPVNTATNITIYGTWFNANSTVAVNGIKIPSLYVTSTEMTATIPASNLQLPGTANLTVTSPAPGGGTTTPYPFTAYLGITNNDVVYNATDGLLYASIPGSSTTVTGNSVVGIDPVTGNIVRQIFVGSNPNKLALSTDGTQLFVGLDGANAVAQVSLTSGQVVGQFSLNSTSGTSNSLYTAVALAAVPGQSNSVAILASSGIVGIYDSGVTRANTYSTYYYYSGSLAFGATSSTLYVASSYSGIEALTVGSTGITGNSAISTSTASNYNIQYDNGQLYLSNGTVLNASTGALEGTFYATTSTTATGPVVSDSSLGLAFVAYSNYSNTPQVLAFNESTFNPAGSFTLNASSTGLGVTKIVRWGQNGLALDAGSQLYIFQSQVVKNLSATPADLSVSLVAPSTAATGSPISYVATINNVGPNQAQDATLTLNLDASLIINSVTPSQGSCGTGSSFNCDLGNLANGDSATVTVSATPTNAATVAGVASVTSVSYDPTATNNQATTSTMVTGSLYGAVPTVSSISPALIQAGSASFTLTVNGTGFNADSVVNLGSTALTTTFASPTQITAEVDSSLVTNYGWTPITVANPSPGGGTSQVAPLTIYAVVNVPANAIVFDPYSQQIYASVPSAATTITGNTIVAINPVTAAVATPIAVGSQPTAMAETSDGNYLYVGLNGSDSLAQFNLLTQSVTATIPLTYNNGGSSGSTTATSLATMPGTDTTLAIGLSSGWNNFGIFDVTSNTTGSFRTNYSGFYAGANPIFASPTELYGGGSALYRYTVDSSGLTLVDSTSFNGTGQSSSFSFANGLLYAAGGGIMNPTTTPPTQIATMPIPDFYYAGFTSYGVAVVADGSTEQDFLIANSISAYALVRYDLTNYLPETLVVMPSSITGMGTGTSMLRWGQDGLALLADTTSNNQSVAEILLLQGPLVTPQLLGSNTAASLISISQTSATHGSGNLLLTLTGSNFAPGVAVTWNGNYRTTTITDATHVTIAIPASDLANASTATIVATNPGGLASNSLTFTIN